MVTAPQKIAEPAADPQVGVFNPQYEQPWQDLSVVIGIPLSVFAAFATMALAMAGVADPLLGWGGVTVLWTVYFAVMALLWAGVAGEGRAR
jgi:hypothetical protein